MIGLVDALNRAERHELLMDCQVSQSKRVLVAEGSTELQKT